LEVEGTAHGNRIDLDEPLGLTDGTRVRVQVAPTDSPRCGTPDAILRLADTLSPEEADAMLEASRSARTIDPALWS
jgi:hypothetical protein